MTFINWLLAMEAINVSLLVPVVMAGRYVNVAVVRAEFGWVPIQVTGVVPDVGAPNSWVVAGSVMRSVPIVAPVTAVCVGAAYVDVDTAVVEVNATGVCILSGYANEGES
jgi:hypothetical protein